MEESKARSIRLPEYVWDALDKDSARCRRSSQKQLEAILLKFYGLEDVEIDTLRLEVIGELLPNSRTKNKVD